MGQCCLYLDIESILLQYRDEIPQPPSHSSTHKNKEKLEILDTNLEQSKEMLAVIPYFWYLFFVLRHGQQPGSYCAGKFTGGGTSAYLLVKILHCKPLCIGK